MSTLEEERTETLTADRPLSALDRCDSCGAQAYVRAVLNGSELLFCAHHARKHEGKLRPMAEVWHDESDRLNS